MKKSNLFFIGHCHFPFISGLCLSIRAYYFFQSRQILPQQLTYLVLVLPDFIQLGFVNVPAGIFTPGNLVDVIRHDPEQPDHFTNLWEIQVQRISVEHHRADERGLVYDSCVIHPSANHFIFRF